MEYKLATRIQTVQGSIIRELFKLAQDPEIIGFGGGNPDAASFPVAAIETITADILARNPASVLQYGLSEGYPPLRETMKAHLRRTEGFDFDQDELFIVSGGQQAADIAAKVLVDEGETVLAEDPAFVGCLNAFRSYGAVLAGIPMEPDGMDMDALEHALQTDPKVRLIYTIPSFQNPTGFTTSAAKRRRIYELACKYDVMVLEDNPYGELRFSGDPAPAIKTLDTDGRVLYGGSFSKVMAPAFRLGTLVFDKALTSRITVAKQCADVHSNTLFQHICHKFMTEYDYDGHIDAIRTLYKHKAELMLASMERHFHPAVRYTPPQGGMFVMCFLPEGRDALPFVEEGIRRKVACVPGIAFAVDQSRPSNGFRMNYTTPTDGQIVRGVEILGKLTHEWLS